MLIPALSYTFKPSKSLLLEALSIPLATMKASGAVAATALVGWNQLGLRLLGPLALPTVFFQIASKTSRETTSDWKTSTRSMSLAQVLPQSFVHLKTQIKYQKKCKELQLKHQQKWNTIHSISSNLHRCKLIHEKSWIPSFQATHIIYRGISGAGTLQVSSQKSCFEAGSFKLGNQFFPQLSSSVCLFDRLSFFLGGRGGAVDFPKGL